MRIILLEEIQSLGKVGDIVDVAAGYGRNYLIPKHFAIPATKGNLTQIDNIKRVKSAQEEKTRFRYEKIAEKLSGFSIDIPMEVSEEDSLFGAVTAAMIADILREKGFDVNKHQIELEKPIKMLGVYNVSVKLYQDIQPKVRIWVVRK